MITLFLGIESATEIREEVKDARRTIPRGIALAVALTAVVYGAVAAVSLALVGPETLGASSAPLLEAAGLPPGCVGRARTAGRRGGRPCGSRRACRWACWPSP